jgi:hypothetical protein
MNISTDKIYLLGLKNGLFSVITEFNEDDDVNSQIQSNSSLRNNFYYYENIALASIKKDGSSLFRIYVPFQEIPEIESLFQPMESLKANSKYDFMGSRLYTFKRIDSYCGTNFAEVYLGTIDKNQ